MVNGFIKFTQNENVFLKETQQNFDKFLNGIILRYVFKIGK